MNALGLYPFITCDTYISFSCQPLLVPHGVFQTNVFKYLSMKKYQRLNKLKKKKKKIEEIFFHVLNTMVAKTMQGVSSNLFVICWKFSHFVPRNSNTLRNLPTFRALDFPKLLDAIDAIPNYRTTNLKKLLNYMLDLSFYWLPSYQFCRFCNTSFLSFV